MACSKSGTAFKVLVGKHLLAIGVIVCLDEEEIGVGILGWPLIEPCFFIWRKLCLKSRGDFLREIGLDGEDVSQIAVVIFGPNVLVAVCVDQLHAHSDAIADATDAAFQKCGYAQRFAYFAGVAHGIATIRHDRHARDDLQIADLCKIGEDIVLHAVGEVSVLLFIAKALKGQDGNRLLDLARGRSGQEEETRSSGNDHADRDQHYQIAATVRSGRGGCRSRADTLRSDIVGPGQDQRDRKPD